MPYVFSDWEHCTDPAGNARTLDWSEEGMRGQPPGLYMEALRQAAAQRAAVAGGYVHPGLTHEVVPMHGIAGIPKQDDPGDFLGLYMLLWYVDAVAWNNPGYSTAGWVNPAAVADIAGSTDLTGAWTAPMNTTALLLEAIGQPSRLAIPESFVGGFPGAYLRQLRDVFRVQTIYQVYVENPGAEESLVRSTGDLAPPWSWASVESAFAAAAWSDGWSPPQYQVYAGYTTSVRRFAGRIRWIRNGSASCRHVTGYLYPQRYGNAFYNPDYPHLIENTWCRQLDDVALAEEHGDYLGNIDNAGLAPPPGWSEREPSSSAYSWGYYFRGMFSRCDYREDFTLGI